KWACPIGYAEIVLVGLADRNITITKLDDAKTFNIGAVRADVGEQLLLNNGFDETKLMAANRLAQALKMLTSGRVDLVSTNKTTMEQLIVEQKLDPARFKEQWVLSSEQFCFAFSHPVSDELVKEFQIGLTRVLAAEYGAQGVRVNALLPGGTDTPMGRAFANTPESLAFVQNMHALKRLAQPEEIARSALYLASDASSFTTGIALLADGGVSICRT
ncbi:SDR family oxidoreductase, partial [Aeromonas sp. CPF2-S1]|nr:SDR family oxidoreductase [Aeromonas sp. CPF2-S1]